MKSLGQRSWARIRQKQSGNVMFKESFSTIKSKPNKTFIFALRNEDGNVISKRKI